jgi:hypothetical protein
MATSQLFRVRVKRGPRVLSVRQFFTSVEEARAYVREQWRSRQLGFWYESPEASEYTGAIMLLAGHESFWIEPFAERPVCRLPSTPSPTPTRLQLPAFEDWLRYVFDRPVPEDDSDAWYWHDDDAAWDSSGDPAMIVAYLRQLFEGGATLVRPYSDGQVAQGLGYLINNSLSNYMFPLMNPDVVWPERQRAIRAMYVVFERIFDPKCSPHLSHTVTVTEPGPERNPLNGECYMWWDVCPLHGHPGPTSEEDFILATQELVDPGPRVDPHAADLEAEILGVLERTLALDNVACQEAALHGLGHRRYKHAAQVESIVDAYIQRYLPTWPADEQGQSLRSYAFAARRGMVQ